MITFIKKKIQARKDEKIRCQREVELQKQKLIQEEMNLMEERARERAIIAYEESCGVKRLNDSIVGWIFTREPRKPGYTYTYDSLTHPRGYPIPHRPDVNPSQCYKTIEEAFYYRRKSDCIYLQKVELKSDGIIWEQCNEWGGFYTGTKISIKGCWRANIGIVWCQMNIIYVMLREDKIQQLYPAIDWKEVYEFLLAVEKCSDRAPTIQQKKKFNITRDKIEKSVLGNYSTYHQMRDNAPCLYLVWLLMQSFNVKHEHWDASSYGISATGYQLFNIFEEMLRVSKANKLYDRPDPFYGLMFDTIKVKLEHCEYIEDPYRLAKKPIPHLLDDVLTGNGPNTEWCNAISNSPQGGNQYDCLRSITSCDKDEYSRFIPFDQIIKYEKRI
jgi:hypothetical protein